MIPRGPDDEWVTMRQFAELEGHDLEDVIVRFLQLDDSERATYAAEVYYSRAALRREMEISKAKEAAALLGLERT